MRPLIIVLSIATTYGCNDDEQACPDGLFLVQITTSAETAFAGFREGTGEWEPLNLEQRVSPLCVRNDYEVVVVCAGTRYSTEYTAATAAEVKQLDTLRCETATSRVSVTGHVQQAAHVSIGAENVGQRSSTGWDFNLGVEAGRYDMIVSNGFIPAPDARVVIRRDLSIAAATTVTPVDVDHEGTALTAFPLTVVNTGSDVITTRTELETRRNKRARAFVSETNDAVALLTPQAVTEVGDRQHVIAFANAPGRQRSASRIAAGDSISPIFELPETLAGVEFIANERPHVAWPDFSTGNYSQAKIQLISATYPYNIITVSASRGWIAVNGEPSIYSDVPGYEQVWGVSLAEPYAWTFSVVSVSADNAIATSTVSNFVEP